MSVMTNEVASKMLWNEILCLGDSITNWARDELGRNFPLELATILCQKTGQVYYCHNRSVNGDTSNDLLKRIWRDCSSAPTATVATVLIGTNDTRLPTTEQMYEDNLRQIINVIKLHKKLPIIIELPPLSYSLGCNYLRNREHYEKYNTVLRNLCENSCMYFELGEEITSCLPDGIHFSNKGNRLLGEKLADYVLSIGSRVPTGRVAESVVVADTP